MNIIKILTSKYRKLLILLADILVILGSSLITCLLLHTSYINLFLNTFIIQIFIYCSIFLMFNIYNKLWRCADIRDISFCFISSLLAGIIYHSYLYNIYNTINLTYCIINILISTSSLCLYRVIYKSLRNFMVTSRSNLGENLDNNTIILSSEKNIDKLSLQLITLDKSLYNVKGIIIDNPFITNASVNGITVIGLIDDVELICKKYNIKNILISNELLSDNDLIINLKEISKNSKIKVYKFNCVENLNTTPSFETREIKIDELLGRNKITINISSIGFIQNKVILITGGGGSIGSELCRQISKYNPKKLIIIDNYENNAYEIQKELEGIYGNNFNTIVEIASIQDIDKMETIFSKYHPNLVFHAAAHKHVPLMEHNPEEAIKNNVFGTLNVVKMADKYNAEKFVLISTDKAVNPTNIMGASKRITEMIIQYYSVFSCTSFVAVRFGNVLGSNGSVIPLFKKQIELGGPITITHPNVVRYFMTISEAVGLILQAGEIANGGEIFVLDMGEPVKIKTLAENMIKLYNLEIDKDIEIKYIGLRPGEKLYEELFMEQEQLSKTSNNKIYIGKHIEMDMPKFINDLKKLRHLCDMNDSDGIFDLMPNIVTTYNNIGNRERALINEAI